MLYCKCKLDINVNRVGKEPNNQGSFVRYFLWLFILIYLHNEKIYLKTLVFNGFLVIILIKSFKGG